MQSGVHREIRQIREYLKAEFAGPVDMTDVGGLTAATEQQFLSRALAALVVRRLLGCDKKRAADCVVDGSNDLGIDAIAVSESGLDIWLIQSKWSDVGKDAFNVAEVLKFREGVNALDHKRFDRFNPKVRRHADQLNAAWGQFGCRITLVVATVGTGALTHDVTVRFEEMKRDYNGLEESLTYESWGRARIWETAKEFQRPPTATILAELSEWIHVPGPFEAFQGRIPVANVAAWYAEYKDLLFEQNIRKSLGLTKVNQGLVETLTTHPDDFWYFNNGITVLCRTAERTGGSYSAKLPIRLELADASIVNGAQTVAAIDAAMQKDPNATSEAFVTIKIVTTKNCPDDFGDAVTEATNTQNQVIPRDFVALDRIQWEIRQDFVDTLRLQYTFKRGEDDPAEAEGCSVLQAALALACAHTNSDLAVRAKQNRDRLWEKDDKGAYTMIFRPRPSAAQIWRSVLVVRAVKDALKHARGRVEDKAAAIADYGDLLITHLVFRQLDTDDIDEPDVDWDAVVSRAAELTAPTLDWLIHHVDAAFGEESFASATFTNPARCRILVPLVLESIANGGKAPDLPRSYVPPPRDYRAPRRRNAVPTLVDAGVIADGETLYFQFSSSREAKALSPWLVGHPERSRARWVNHRTRPLIWEFDGKQYSPTGLVSKIWENAGWTSHPVAVQGPDRWAPADRGTLWELAKAIQDQDGEALF
ncbi:AIPR family protein [Actinocorallia sp. A-T 12471]|uniref:AIPR family protein n=1 Tax=Actinocorallia sp. A-T 12471 TaxID=3089813 RepID=UPI0029CC3D3D|nr:AIPR family protein [Actinocorallia sp. A-T 12471]MDX6741154.1 AIPR family protein [Actinocorallia sp. A-T 12471]